MKYIRVTETGQGFDLDHRPYWEYLASVCGSMPPHILAFASNPENHNLRSPNSLHDSWLSSWTFSEETDPSSSRRQGIVRACFLGPRHDRHIHLTYFGVSSYHIVAREIPHGDLIAHEMVATNEAFRHELLFVTGAAMVLEFADFAHHSEML